MKARERKRERGNSSSVFCGHNTTEGERARESERQGVRKREREKLLSVICGHDTTLES